MTFGDLSNHSGHASCCDEVMSDRDVNMSSTSNCGFNHSSSCWYRCYQKHIVVAFAESFHDFTTFHSQFGTFPSFGSVTTLAGTHVPCRATPVHLAQAYVISRVTMVTHTHIYERRGGTFSNGRSVTRSAEKTRYIDERNGRMRNAPQRRTTHVDFS